MHSFLEYIQPIILNVLEDDAFVHRIITTTSSKHSLFVLLILSTNINFNMKYFVKY